ncbi:MAG: hypothetical protein KIG63_08150, partial [Methanobrevibacter sp.]|nr:hypothetical protein [Methanobrevibacter sp.]
IIYIWKEIKKKYIIYKKRSIYVHEKTYLYCWSVIHKRRNSQFVIGTTEDFVDGTIAEEFDEAMCRL